MSENDEIISEDIKKEPEIIYLEYQGNIDSTAENIILEVTEKDFSDNEEEKPLKSENRTISLQEIDSPDLVNIEDYKIDDHRYASTSENIEERCMVTLSEASYDSEISIEVDDIINNLRGH